MLPYILLSIAVLIIISLSVVLYYALKDLGYFIQRHDELMKESLDMTNENLNLISDACKVEIELLEEIKSLKDTLKKNNWSDNHG